MDIGTMVDKILNYDKTLRKHHYNYSNPGIKPWSRRHACKDGTAIEIRNSEWTYYDADDKEITTGTSPDQLDEFLSGF